MPGRWNVLLSLPVMAVVVAAITFAVILVGQWFGLGTYTLVLLAIPVAVAVGYLAWYRTLPFEPGPPKSSPGAPVAESDPEPFEDPVEEADRLAEEGDPSEATASTSDDEQPPEEAVPPTPRP